MSEDPRVIADYMDVRVCCRLRADDGSTRLRGVSRPLVTALESVGIRGRSVLDVGCGAGELCLTLLDRGAVAAAGVDLSPRSVERARQTSREHGVADRVTFRVGDGSQAVLAAADVVVLDKVYCCYFDPAALMANTVPAARQTYAIVLPPSRGLRGVLARTAIGLENLGRRVRGNPFRGYVHDVTDLDAAIRAAGFRPALRRRRLLWDIRIYARHGHAS